jgi:hypothetical protein
MTGKDLVPQKTLYQAVNGICYVICDTMDELLGGLGEADIEELPGWVFTYAVELGFQAFKIGFSNQVAANFSPLVARYLYEKYTEHCKDEGVLQPELFTRLGRGSGVGRVIHLGPLRILR